MSADEIPAYIREQFPDRGDWYLVLADVWAAGYHAAETDSSYGTITSNPHLSEANLLRGERRAAEKAAALANRAMGAAAAAEFDRLGQTIYRRHPGLQQQVHAALRRSRAQAAEAGQ